MARLRAFERPSLGSTTRRISRARPRKPSTSARLASASDLDFISAEITHAICQTLHPARFTLYVRRSEKDLYVPYPAAPGLESLAFDQLRALRSQTEPVDLPQGGEATIISLKPIPEEIREWVTSTE